MALFLIFNLLLSSLTCPWITATSQVKTGLENFLENHLDLVQGKRLGLLVNQTSVDSRGRPIVEILSEHAQIVMVLFGPEHGFMGDVEDAAEIKDTMYNNVQLYSLYGEFLSPTPKMLEDVDVLVYDIQDVGVKFYTFISNLFLAMHAAKRDNIPVVVLDRPNPVNATIVSGAITNPAFSSFVGVLPLPIRYGMTVGEIAALFNNESYGGFSLGIDLTVIPMTGYKRDMWYDETGIPWVIPSPNMPTLETAVIYPGMCLIEGTNLSEGRGTESPFLTIGAPYINSKDWLEALPKKVLEDAKTEFVEFSPKSIPGVVTTPKYEDKKCYGLHFTVLDREKLEPIELAVAVLCATQKLYPEEFQMTKYLDKLWGNEDLRAMVSEGHDYRTIMKTCEQGIDRFKKVRQKYLRYD
ncbi:MAG: DUF1343 domain-containing protein [Candidatus Aminicenantes bacterium]|jgi:uncharacterized protein YbbC (DUF1343 family)